MRNQPGKQKRTPPRLAQDSGIINEDPVRKIQERLFLTHERFKDEFIVKEKKEEGCRIIDRIMLLTALLAAAKGGADVTTLVATSPTETHAIKEDLRGIVEIPITKIADSIAEDVETLQSFLSQVSVFAASLAADAKIIIQPHSIETAVTNAYKTLGHKDGATVVMLNYILYNPHDVKQELMRQVRWAADQLAKNVRDAAINSFMHFTEGVDLSGPAGFAAGDSEIVSAKDLVDRTYQIQQSINKLSDVGPMAEAIERCRERRRKEAGWVTEELRARFPERLFDEYDHLLTDPSPLEEPERAPT